MNEELEVRGGEDISDFGDISELEKTGLDKLCDMLVEGQVLVKCDTKVFDGGCDV